MSRADDSRPTTPVSLFSSYKPVPIRRIAASPPTKQVTAEPKPTAEQPTTSTFATKYPAQSTTATTTCSVAPSKASTLARLANAQSSSTALVPTVRPRSSSLRPHPRQTTVAFGRTTLVNGKTTAPKTPRAPKTPVFTAAAATTVSARQAMSQDLSALKKKVEENAKEIAELKTLVQALQARDEAQQSEIDDLRRSLIRLLERSALGSTRRAANIAAARLNTTVPASEADSQRENRPPSRELPQQRDVGVQRRKRDDAAAPQRVEDPLEDLLNRIERLDPSEQHLLRKRLEGDASQQRQKAGGERFRERSPSEDDSRGAMSTITRRIMHIEETRAMASPRRAAPPPISDYSNNTRQLIDRSRRESPRGRRRERSPVVEQDSDREDYRRDVPRRNQQRRPVIRELSPGDEDYSPPPRFDDDFQTDYEPYFVSHRNDGDY
ncbi:hypothetical protein AAVH_24435 [Aphelenchoides avenae]|nr:hypothetical protein AAVH_24435 [Aphelenchus avenae]